MSLVHFGGRYVAAAIVYLKREFSDWKFATCYMLGAFFNFFKESCGLCL